MSTKQQEVMMLCIERPERVLFLDVETTGLSHYYDEITIIGWSLGGKCHTYIKGGGKPLRPNVFNKADVMVTFNGIRFDQKFLEKEFGHVALPNTHLDLMYSARRVGLTGGQKNIEKELGINVRKDIEEVDGFAAVLLWHKYIRGDVSALRKLIKYNRADIAAMGSILDQIINKFPATQRDLFNTDVRFVDWSAPEGWDKTNMRIPRAKESMLSANSFDSLFADKQAGKSRIMGIDLTGSENRPTGWCLLDGNTSSTKLLGTDKEIIEETIEVKPDLVSIDSPLCLPYGRKTVFDDDPTRDEFGIMRVCERELKRRGINVYPSLLPSMQNLTARGIKIAGKLREKGIPVIESYPGAAQDIMRIPRKGAGVHWLKQGLADFGIAGDFLNDDVSHDELDAITSALVGTFHLADMTEELGTEHEPPLIIPDLQVNEKPVVVGVSGLIAAGKTTLSRHLEEQGFAYVRFSETIDAMLKESGQQPNRNTRQALGEKINQEGRQRELAQRTLEKAQGRDKIVVDGLRFPEDHTYLYEKYGLNYIHVFIDASQETRRMRYESDNYMKKGEKTKEYDEAIMSPVEASVGKLRNLARQIIQNEGSLIASKYAISNAVRTHMGSSFCLFLLSWVASLVPRARAKLP